MIAHPDCTYLSVSGQHWNKHVPGRVEKTDPAVRSRYTEEAVEFFRFLLETDIPRIAIENPVGIISTRIRKPNQIIQPWQYGHPESKATCLWLKNLPVLEPTNILTPTKFQTNGRPQWDNMTPSGQSNLGPSATRWMDRSRTYEGIADAMAAQWGAAL